ncbi:helix-turn-helix domain-containing protein [Marinomonas epiphytica]
MKEHRSAPAWSGVVQQTEAYDADLHANNLTNWQQEYDQTSCGDFYGRITELSFDGLQVFSEYTSQSLQQRCVVWPDSVWLGIPVSNQAEGKINGLNIQSNAIMCRQGGAEFQLSTPQEYRLFGLVVSQYELQEVAAIHGLTIHWQDFTEFGRLKLPSEILNKARYILQRLLSVEKNEVPSRLQKEVVMMVLLELLKAETPVPAKTQSYHHRKKVVDCVSQYLQQHTDAAVTVTQLCQIANVSRRSLQYSFESILGVSPIQYLRLTRLNGVRRDLMKASHEKTRKSVGQVAEQWGFWHLSQFSKDYKLLFNETPSKTLKLNEAS